MSPSTQQGFKLRCAVHLALDFVEQLRDTCALEARDLTV